MWVATATYLEHMLEKKRTSKHVRNPVLRTHLGKLVLRTKNLHF